MALIRRLLVAFLCLFTLSSGFVLAQQRLDLDSAAWVCSYYGEPYEEAVYTFTSDAEANKALDNILQFTGLERNFQFQAANVPNALATMQGGRRYILYNQQFMQNIAQSTGNPWSEMSILAHELGHHLQGHTSEGMNRDRHKMELEADKYSGFVMASMNVSLEDAQSAMKTFPESTGSTTHPPKSARLAAITNGWKQRKVLPDIKGKPPKDPIEQETLEKPKPQPDATRPGYVLRCVFPADPRAFFVTTTDDIVTVDTNGNSYIVGRRMPSPNPNFAWVYATNAFSYGVSHHGHILGLSPYGQIIPVGYVTHPQ